MNKARSCLLLIVSLSAGCEGWWKEDMCTDGWAEFTCSRSDAEGCESLTEHSVKGKQVRSSPRHKTLTVVIKCKESENQHCRLHGSNSTNLRMKFEGNSCQTPSTHTTYKHINKTISCDFPVNKYKSWFFCKEKDSRCEDVLPKMQVTATDKGFSVSTALDAGVYWCGLRADNRSAVRRVQVQELTDFSRSPTAGQNFSYFCKYEKDFDTVFICKGEDPWSCQPVVSTDEPRNARFSLKHETKDSNITVTLTDVRAEDAGTYWCGGRRPDKTPSHKIFHRFQMSVVPASSGAAAHGHSQLVAAVAVCAALLLLLCVLNFILFYKRLSLSKSSGSGSDVERGREDHIYEEIQDLQHPVTTIYTTAHFSIVPSDAAPKPSSAACDYSTVVFAARPASPPVTESDPQLNFTI